MVAQLRKFLFVVLMVGVVGLHAASAPFVENNGSEWLLPVDLPGIPVTIGFMLDTGSGYNFIVPALITKMLEAETAEIVDSQDQNFIKTVDGSYRPITLFILSSLSIGGCKYEDVPMATFKGLEINIIGVDMLKLMSPIILDYDGGELGYSCTDKEEPE